MAVLSVKSSQEAGAWPVQTVLMSLAVVGRKPTGLANYAANVARCWPTEAIQFLLPFEMPGLPACQNGDTAESSWFQIPQTLSADDGKRGHLNRLLWTQGQLPGWMRRTHADVLFSPIPEAPLGVRGKTVVMVHDLIPLRFPRWRSPLYSYFRFYVPAVLRQANHIICNSVATADEIMTWFDLPAQVITPIPLAHDERNFRVLSEAERQEWEPPDRPYFVHLGRHDPHKNVGVLIEALARMAVGDRPDLWLVGPADPRYTPALQARAAELGVGDRVKCIGYAAYQELPKILAGAIALTFPSLWEGFGFPVLEAMACGTPVLTSTVSALPEVAGDAALLLDPHSPNEWAAAMTQVLTDPTLQAQLRQTGLHRATQFSWQKTAEQTAAIVAQV